MSVNCKRIDKNDRNVNKDVNDWGEIFDQGVTVNFDIAHQNGLYISLHA